ncbi:RICIN domain-containing protein [Micromonospora sp. DT233]|uniref:RICIN domain-containing protein n=1 Tax=Micromonospora sp. DT233 TaxID=3393432 RepID=UPI003CF7C29D
MKAQGVCLDSNFAGNVYVGGCNGGAYQRWHMNKIGPALYNVINVATGRCLDAGANWDVYTLPCNGGNYQKWQIF